MKNVGTEKQHFMDEMNKSCCSRDLCANPPAQEITKKTFQLTRELLAQGISTETILTPIPLRLGHPQLKHVSSGSGNIVASNGSLHTVQEGVNLSKMRHQQKLSNSTCNRILNGERRLTILFENFDLLF